MRILLTGSSGFIGRHLLARNQIDDFLCLVRTIPPFANKHPNVQFVKASIENVDEWRDSVLRFKPETCIHLAWSFLPDYSLSKCLYNFTNSIQFVTALLELGIPHFVLAGSCLEYGNKPGLVLESDFNSDISLFGAVKCSLRQVLNSIFSSYPTSTYNWARIFYAYGPYQRLSSLIPSLSSSIRDNLPLQLKRPDLSHDYIHIDDVASALLLLANKSLYSSIYNISSSSLTSNAEIANKLLSLYGQDSLFSPPYPLVGTFGSNQLIYDDYGWSPSITIDSGLKSYVSHMSS